MKLREVYADETSRVNEWELLRKKEEHQSKMQEWSMKIYNQINIWSGVSFQGARLHS